MANRFREGESHVQMYYAMNNNRPVNGSKEIAYICIQIWKMSVWHLLSSTVWINPWIVEMFLLSSCMVVGSIKLIIVNAGDQHDVF